MMKNPKNLSAKHRLNIRSGRRLQKVTSLESLNMQVARLIYELRTEAGLTQQQLAKRVGTTQPAIARLEARNYRGHSLTMLQRIVNAVAGKIEIRFSSVR